MTFPRKSWRNTTPSKRQLRAAFAAQAPHDGPRCKCGGTTEPYCGPIPKTNLLHCTVCGLVFMPLGEPVRKPRRKWKETLAEDMRAVEKMGLERSEGD